MFLTQGWCGSSGPGESAASESRHGALPHTEHALQQEQRLPGQDCDAMCVLLGYNSAQMFTYAVLECS